MRTIITVAAMALSLGLVGIQTSSAEPCNGKVIANAAELTQVEQVQYYGYESPREYRSYGGYGYDRGYGGYGYRRS